MRKQTGRKKKKKKFCYALNSVLCFQAQILKELRPQRLTLNKMEDLKGIGGLSLWLLLCTLSRFTEDTMAWGSSQPHPYRHLESTCNPAQPDLTLNLPLL